MRLKLGDILGRRLGVRLVLGNVRLYISYNLYNIMYYEECYRYIYIYIHTYMYTYI